MVMAESQKSTWARESTIAIGVFQPKDQLSSARSLRDFIAFNFQLPKHFIWDHTRINSAARGTDHADVLSLLAAWHSSACHSTDAKTFSVGNRRSNDGKFPTKYHSLANFRVRPPPPLTLFPPFISLLSQPVQC